MLDLRQRMLLEFDAPIGYVQVMQFECSFPIEHDRMYLATDNRGRGMPDVDLRHKALSGKPSDQYLLLAFARVMRPRVGEPDALAWMADFMATRYNVERLP